MRVIAQKREITRLSSMGLELYLMSLGPFNNPLPPIPAHLPPLPASLLQMSALYHEG